MAKKLAFKQGAYKEAVDYFRQKINLPTRRWNDLEGAMHTKAFTVAGAMRADILLDFRKAVDRAIEKGDSLQDFRNNFYDIAKKWRAADPSFDAKMEKPKYGAWRSKVIYQTNMVTAAAAAQERQARAMPDVFTHAKYICQMLPGSRDEHKAWNGTVLPVNDPWWEKHSPPNGFGCLCEKEFISKYEMDAGMEKQTKAPTAPNDTTNIGEKWDYSIGDADAENQRLKDYEEEKVKKVAKLYKNEDIKPLEKETKAKSKKQEQRRAEIQKMADERHANRTATEADKIQAKWTLSHPHSQMPKKFNGVGDIATFWNKIDKARETLGQERIFQNGDFKFGRINNKYNGDTSMDGTINLHRKIHNLCVSAFEKLRLGKNLSEDECRAIGTLWHEMTHNRHKLNGGIFHRPPGKSLDYMEMANEFVARKTLPELFGLIGAKSAPYKQFMISRDNCGYDDWVVRLDTALDTFGINKDSFLKQARTDLFDGNYDMQKELLVNNMASHVKGMDTADATKIVAQCIKYKGISFETDVLTPIKSKLGGKK